jgi:hypothetical protein
MLEVVNGIVEKIILIRSKLFKKEDILSFNLMLNIGNISNLEDTTSRSVCNINIQVNKKIQLFLSEIKEKENIRFWYSSMNSEDVCFISFAIYLINKHFSNKKIYIIDACEKNMPTLGSFLFNEIKELINIEKRLSDETIHSMIDNWNLLVNENSDLRLLINGKLNSFSFSYLDNKIMNSLSKYDELNVYSFVGIELLPRGLCSIYGDLIFHYRINELIKQNKIKITNKDKKFIKLLI